jgi:hypothetical protein
LREISDKEHGMSGSSPEGLEIFVGTWTVTGLIFGSAEETPRRFTATDRFEMMPGGKVLLRRSEGLREGVETSALEAIRDSGDGYECTLFDREGQASHACARLDGQSWQIDGPDSRFRGRFDAGFERLTGQWYCDDETGTDRLWQQVTMTRIED